MDGYGWWLILVGMAIALALVWLFAVRLPRGEADVSDPERAAEAAWISRVIERDGGIAPVPLVEEVLELHQAYLADPRLAQPPVEPSPAPVSPQMGPPVGSLVSPPVGSQFRPPGAPPARPPGAPPEMFASRALSGRRPPPPPGPPAR